MATLQNVFANLRKQKAQPPWADLELMEKDYRAGRLGEEDLLDVYSELVEYWLNEWKRGAI